CDVGLVNAGPVDDERVGNDEIESALFGHTRGLPHVVAQHLAAAELAFVTVGRVVALDLHNEAGVGQPHTIAGGRSVDICVMPMWHPVAHRRPRPSVPRRSISATVLLSPGSKRTAVPAGMSNRLF